MNRLHLRIYEPPVEDDTTAKAQPSLEALELATDRHIIPFESQQRTTIISGRYVEPIDRARLLHDNSECPHCEKSDIEPLELQDAVISPKSRLPVPGTATIVGFHCNECGSEWPVYELTTRRNG